MKRIIPIGLALAVMAGLAPPARAQTGVTDDAKMFTDGAVWKADDELAGVARETGWQIVLQTINSLDGQLERDRAVSEARKLGIHGLYVLIARKEHKVWLQPSSSAQATFTRERIGSIRDALTSAFRRSEFDQGLLQAVEEISKDARLRPRRSREAEAPAQGPANPPQAPAAPEGTNVTWLVIGGAVVLVLLWLVSRAFRRPQAAPARMAPQGPAQAPAGNPPGGYAPRPGPAPGGYGYGPGQAPAPGPGYPGGPAYGPAAPPPRQGGGFVSGMLGGLGGAVVGNILYDKFGRPLEHGASHEHGVPPGSYPAGSTPPMPPDQAGVSPSAESYDPAAGQSGDWGSAQPQAGEAAAGAEGNWGAPPENAPDQPSPESWNENAGAEGDWGDPNAGAEGDWNADNSAPDTAEGAGGDWGGDQDQDQDQGGGW